MESSFTDKNNWTGPFFELIIELGPHPDSIADTRPALEALWEHPTLDGPYESHLVPIAGQRIAVIGDGDTADLHFHGMAMWPDGSRSPCGATTSIPHPEPGVDELIFYLPSLYGEPQTIDWWDEANGKLDAALRDWFTELAGHVSRQVPFELAAIGPEALWDLERGESDDTPVLGVTVLRSDSEGGGLSRLDAVE